jgi:hypothetical protein
MSRKAADLRVYARSKDQTISKSKFENGGSDQSQLGNVLGYAQKGFADI